jgi:hypothetical protein
MLETSENHMWQTVDCMPDAGMLAWTSSMRNGFLLPGRPSCKESIELRKRLVTAIGISALSVRMGDCATMFLIHRTIRIPSQISVTNSVTYMYIKNSAIDTC